MSTSSLLRMLLVGGPLGLALLPGCGGAGTGDGEGDDISAPEPEARADAPLQRWPNIIFVMADDMTADQFNFRPAGRGKNLSPNLDRLAAQGTVMWGQFVTSPVCTPSRFSTLTGKYASRARNPEFVGRTAQAGQSIVQWNTHIQSDDVTLPRLLKQAGYATGMVGKNHVVRPTSRRAIAKTANPRDPAVAADLKFNADQARAAVRAVGFDYASAIYPGNADEISPTPLGVHNMEWITKAGLDFIDQNKAKPFFLYFATTLTHSPLSKNRATGADPLATPEGYLSSAPNVQPPRHTIATRVRQAGLDGSIQREMVLWMDDAIGALMARLEQHGILDDTIIVFFNDNGQAGKGSIYRSGARSPSVVWKKGGFAVGHATEAGVTNVDFAPTLLELAGAPVPAGLDGASFKPVLDGAKTWIHDGFFFEMGFTRAVQRKNWKYIALRYPANPTRFALDANPPYMQGVTVPPGNPGFGHLGGNFLETLAMKNHPAYFDYDQLYDLSTDPGETKNLAKDPTYATALATMRAQLRHELADKPGGFAEFKTSP